MGKIMSAIMDLYPGYESVEILEMDAFTLREPQTTLTVILNKVRQTFTSVVPKKKSMFHL